MFNSHVIIIYFGVYIGNRNKVLSENQAVVDSLYTSAKGLAIEYKDSTYSKDLDELSELLRYSDNSALSNDEVRILEMIEELRKLLYKSYERIFIHLRNEENYLHSPDERKLLVNIREQQISKVRFDLELQNGENSQEEIEQQIRKYCRETFDFEDSDFRYVWETCLDEMAAKDKPFFELLLPQIEDETMQRQLKKKLNRLS